METLSDGSTPPSVSPVFLNDRLTGMLVDQAHSPWFDVAFDQHAQQQQVASPGVAGIYAQVHRKIDEISSNIVHQVDLAPDWIREENRKVVEKLFSIEHEVVRRSSSTPTSSSGTQSLEIAPGSECSELSHLSTNETDAIPVSSRTPPIEPWLEISPMDILEFQSASVHDPVLFGDFGDHPEEASITTMRTPSPQVLTLQTPTASHPSPSDIFAPSPRPGSKPRATGRKRRKLRPEASASSACSPFKIALNPLVSNGNASTAQAGASAAQDDATRVFTLRLQDRPKLAHKILQINDAEVMAAAAEFTEKLRDHEYRRSVYGGARGDNSCSGPAESYNFPTVSRLGRDGGTGFLRMLPRLAVAIESSIFGEQEHRIKKRIALAHFYHAYTLAQENPQTFLSWCHEQADMARSMLPKGNLKSMVQHRFADLMFPPDQMKRLDSSAGAVDGSSGTVGVGDWRKARISKIQMWRKSGKHWARLIMRFGYGVLLLMPPSLTDEDLRLAHDEEMAAILDLIESRKHTFAETLESGNELFRTQFFAEEQPGLIQSTSSSEEPRRWGDLLPFL